MRVATGLARTGFSFIAASSTSFFASSKINPSSGVVGLSLSSSSSSSYQDQTNNEQCSNNMILGKDYPELVVFDLDACFWDQEMYTMSSIPTADNVVTGKLGSEGEGVIGVYSGGDKISLHDGSMAAMQEIYSGAYPGMKVCFASSADTPFAEKVGKASLKLLEIVPGKTIWDFVVNDCWNGEDVNQIGRQPPLSSNKAQTHFPRIRKLTGIPYDKMLFFDDCNWGDHCGMVARACQENGKSVVTHRTPRGLKLSDWRKGLELYQKAHSK